MDTTHEVQRAAPGVAAHTAGARLAGANRRVYDRLEFEVDVSFESDHNFYTGFTENISSGGLFISTRDLPPIGARFPITFTLPTCDQPFTVHCEVRWQRLEQLDSVDSAPGVGVRFLELKPGEREAINAFIARRETLFYDDE